MKQQEHVRARRERRLERRRGERAIRERLEISQPTELRVIPRVPSFPTLVKLGQPVQLVPNCNADTWPRNALSPLSIDAMIRNRSERPHANDQDNSGQKSDDDPDEEVNKLLRKESIIDSRFFSSDV